jgi:PKD repeat protein
VRNAAGTRTKTITNYITVLKRWCGERHTNLLFLHQRRLFFLTTARRMSSSDMSDFGMYRGSPSFLLNNSFFFGRYCNLVPFSCFTFIMMYCI